MFLLAAFIGSSLYSILYIQKLLIYLVTLEQFCVCVKDFKSMPICQSKLEKVIIFILNIEHHSLQSYTPEDSGEKDD